MQESFVKLSLNIPEVVGELQGGGQKYSQVFYTYPAPEIVQGQPYSSGLPFHNKTGSEAM